MEREQILACADWRALFGKDVDDRALRAAYAGLAKTWRDDLEVSSHVRALYESARDRTSQPENVQLSLRDALDQGHPQAIWNAIRQEKEVLVLERGSELLEALRFLLYVYGDGLSPEVVDQIDGLIRDPRWDIPDLSAFHLARHVNLHRALARARQEEGPLANVAVALLRAWGHRAEVVMEVWLDLKGQLEEVPLVPLFDTLEEDWPELLGEWTLHESKMMEWVSRSPLELAEIEPLQSDYPPSYMPLKEAVDDLKTLSSYPSQLGISAAIFVCLVMFLPVWTSAVASYGIRAAGLHLWIRYKRPLVEVADSQVMAQPVARLEEFARKHALLPREVSALLSPLAEIPVKAMAFREAHPVLQFDASPTALLKVLTPAHLERARRIASESE